MAKYRITVSVELVDGSHEKKIHIVNAPSRDYAEAYAKSCAMLEFSKIPYEFIFVENCEILEYSKGV